MTDYTGKFKPGDTVKVTFTGKVSPSGRSVQAAGKNLSYNAAWLNAVDSAEQVQVFDDRTLYKDSDCGVYRYFAEAGKFHSYESASLLRRDEIPGSLWRLVADKEYPDEQTGDYELFLGRPIRYRPGLVQGSFWETKDQNGWRPLTSSEHYQWEAMRPRTDDAG